MFLDMFRSGVRLKPLPAFLKQKGTNQIADRSISLFITFHPVFDAGMIFYRRVQQRRRQHPC